MDYYEAREDGDMTCVLVRVALFDRNLPSYFEMRVLMCFLQLVRVTVPRA